MADPSCQELLPCQLDGKVGRPLLWHGFCRRGSSPEDSHLGTPITRSQPCLFLLPARTGVPWESLCPHTSLSAPGPVGLVWSWGPKGKKSFPVGQEGRDCKETFPFWFYTVTDSWVENAAPGGSLHEGRGWPKALLKWVEVTAWTTGTTSSASAETLDQAAILRGGPGARPKGG